MLRLPARPFRLVANHLRLPLSPAASSTVGIWPLVDIFCFTRCVVQHLDLSSKSQGFRSILEGPTSTVCVRCFWRRLRSCICLFRPIFSLVSALVAGSLFSSALVWRQSWGILDPWFSVRKGLWSSRRDCFTTYVMSREVFSLPSVFVILWRRRSQRAVFPSLQRYFLGSSLSFYYVEEERIK